MSEISWSRRFYWSLRREAWEHPSLWVAPLAAAGVAVLGVAVSRVAGAATRLTATPSTATAAAASGATQSDGCSHTSRRSDQ